MTDISEAQIGPTVVGRLKGAAYRIALNIHVKRQDGSTLKNDAAIVATAEPQVTDPSGVVTKTATISGVQQLLNDLQKAYGDE